MIYFLGCILQSLTFQLHSAVHTHLSLFFPCIHITQQCSSHTCLFCLFSCVLASLALFIHAWDRCCRPWQYLSVSILQWTPETVQHYTHNRFPFFFPRVKNLVCHIQYNTYIIQREAESTLTELRSARVFRRSRMYSCVVLRRAHEETRNKSQLRTSLLMFACSYEYLCGLIHFGIRGHGCLRVVCSHWRGGGRQHYPALVLRVQLSQQIIWALSRALIPHLSVCVRAWCQWLCVCV